MTIRQLVCFSVMAEELHYTKAANRLHISQPSLSYSISELEKELDLPLFERKENRTILTQYGEILLPYASAVLKRVDALAAKARELVNPEVGNIRLGSIYSVSFDLIPRILESFYANKAHSQIMIHLSQGVNNVLREQLLNGELDFAVSAPMEDSRLDHALLFTQELYFVVSEHHRLAGRDQVRLEEIQGERLISLGEDSNISTHIQNCFHARGLEAEFAFSVAECSAMGAYISSDMAVAIAPIVPSFHSNSVRIIPFAEPDRSLLSRVIHLSWVRDRYLSPTAKTFCRFVKTHFSGGSALCPN